LRTALFTVLEHLCTWVDQSLFSKVLIILMIIPPVCTILQSYSIKSCIHDIVYCLIICHILIVCTFVIYCFYQVFWLMHLPFFLSIYCVFFMSCIWISFYHLWLSWFTLYMYILPSVLWHCWLVISKSIQLVKNWVLRCWSGYLCGVRCKWFAYGPADTTASSPSSPSGCPGKEAVKWVSCLWIYVCTCICIGSCIRCVLNVICL